MRPVSFALLVAVPAAVALSAARRPATASSAAEIARLRAHFDSVDAELRARDVSALTPSQRAARARHVATLRAYRDRGVFPTNTDFPGRRVAYFVDRDGTACAVGYLLLADGRRDVVDRVRSTDNHALVPALAGDTAFTVWLDASGLTLAEAARIQPEYGGSSDDIDTPTAVMSGIFGVAGGVTVGVSLAARPDAPGRGWRVGAGVAVGALNLLLSGVMRAVDDDGGARTLAAVNAVVGVASLGSAIWAGGRKRAPVPAAGGGDGAPSARRPSELSLAPGLVPSPGGRASAGVVGRLRF
jgi:hypothetical protein